MRLIDADALKKAIIKHLCVKSENNLLPAEKSIYNLIDEQPTIELLKEKQPVKPIQFEKKSKVTRDKYECGVCGSSEIFKQWEYCPWCGVKLDWEGQ